MNEPVTIARRARGKGPRSKQAKQRKAGLNPTAGKRRRVVNDLPHRSPLGAWR
jgi:hypothetical protein